MSAPYDGHCARVLILIDTQCRHDETFLHTVAAHGMTFVSWYDIDPILKKPDGTAG